MNFDTWVQLHEASRISSEPILQRYFECPKPRPLTLDEAEAATRDEEARKRKHLNNLKTKSRIKRRRELEEIAARADGDPWPSTADEPVPEAS